MMLLVLVMSAGMLVLPTQAEDYSPEVTIPVSVALSGGLPEVPETFQIVLEAKDSSCAMPAGSADGVYTLPLTAASGATSVSGKLVIEFNTLGVYTYTISQKNIGNPDCYQENYRYTMTVYVTNAETGGYQTNVAIYRENLEGPAKQDSVTFKNRYANPVDVTLTAIKTMDRLEPKDNKFSFQLLDKDEKLIETVYNDGKNVVFSPLTFDKAGTYQYEMAELLGKDEDIIYDKSIYKVTIDVEKDTNGDYQAKVSYKKHFLGYEGTPRFANYTKTDNPITGDMFRMGLWVTLLGGSLVALIVLIVVGVKKCRNKS